MTGLPWPAAVSLLVGLAMGPLALWGWRNRGRPGAVFYLGTVAVGAVWSLSYGAGLLVVDASLRPLFEVTQWLGMCLAAPFVLGFALEYTGRGTLARSHWTAGVFGLFLGAYALAATNPLHGLMWEAYRIEPTFGAATVQYAGQPMMYAFAGLSYVTIAASLVLLLESALDNGPLYWRQIALVVVALFVPGVANVLWIADLGPWAPLDPTPMAFGVTAVLVGYAIQVEGLFDMVPAVRRLADRVAIDDLGTAVVVVNHRGRVVALNERAATVFDVTERTALGRPLEWATGLDIDLEPGEFIRENPARNAIVNRVTVSPIEGAPRDPIGHVVTVRDVTAERRRRQRLEVLNRVLRHNLRNDATVIEGNARLIREATADTDVEAAVDRYVEEILATSAELIEASTKARDIARALPDAGPRRDPVDLVAVLEELAGELSGATVTLEAPPSATVESDRRLLRIVFANLLENAVVHGGEHVAVTVSRGDGTATVVIADDGPGIPDHELAVLERATEDDLEHGSGLGLWITAWGLSALGGQVDFAVDDGTRVTITLPRGDPDGSDG